jgi:uncharacterized protein
MFRVVAGLMAMSLAATVQAAPVPPEKQAAVQRVLAKMSMESVALAMLQKPIADALAQARVVAQSRVPAEQREAVLKDINASATQTFESEAPLVRASARQAVETAVAPLLAERFSADELRQLAAILESPVLAKFEALTPAMKKTVGDSVARSNQAQVNAALTELQNKIGLRLRSAIAQ